MSETKKCKVEACKRPYRAKGYCTVHYNKWRRGEMPTKARYKTCGEENCRKAIFKFGICEPHYTAWIASKKGVAQAPAAAPAEAAPEAPAAPAPESTPQA